MILYYQIQFQLAKLLKFCQVEQHCICIVALFSLKGVLRKVHHKIVAAIYFSKLFFKAFPDLTIHRRQRTMSSREPSVGGDCNRLYTALTGCHRRFAAGRERDLACRHINRSLAECMVAIICPAESDAVRSLCSSGGTALKRRQCQEAQLSLSVCLASHQDRS